MVDNTFNQPFGASTRTTTLELMTQGAFGAFLLLIFIGLQPFASSEMLAENLIATGKGDLARQVIYIIAFLVIVGLAFSVRGLMAFKAFPIPLVLVIVWCLLSITWAIEPGIAARRAFLTLVLISCVMASVSTLGTARSLQVLRLVMAVVLIINCVSLLIIPQSVHLPGELESELAGNWRGLYNHKNIAGSITALSALLFYHYGLAKHRWIDWLLCVAAVVFLIGTQSKTAIGFFFVSIILSTACRQLCRTESGRRVFIVFFILLLIILAFAWAVAYDSIIELLSDPSLLTGRMAIWQKVFAYVVDHPFLGSGFGSFWGVGESSPAQALSPSEKWLELIPQSHNGYLEILVTTGVIGLLISVAAFVVIPLTQLLGPGRFDIELRSVLFSLFSFTIFSNFLETIFLNRDLPEWVIFLIVLASLHQLSAKGVPSRPSFRQSQRLRETPPPHHN